jgi:1-acyl-sn-glycerol-3-phosphate acyltransferase
MMNKIISYFLFIRFILLILITIFFVSLAFLLFWTRFFKLNIDCYIMKYWGKVCLFIYGIDVNKFNFKNTVGIYAATHSSFWDIVVLSANVKGFFVSKAEVFKWPIIGLGAKVIRTIFIERKKGIKSLKIMAKKAKNILKEDISIIVFPEGTRTYQHLNSFKIGAFNISYETHYPIIPVIVEYLPKDTIISKNKKSFLIELIFQAMNLRKQIINLKFLDSIDPEGFSSPRELKTYTYDFMSKYV